MKRITKRIEKKGKEEWWKTKRNWKKYNWTSLQGRMMDVLPFSIDKSPKLKNCFLNELSSSSPVWDCIQVKNYQWILLLKCLCSKKAFIPHRNNRNLQRNNQSCTLSGKNLICQWVSHCYCKANHHNFTMFNSGIFNKYLIFGMLE